MNWHTVDATHRSTYCAMTCSTSVYRFHTDAVCCFLSQPHRSVLATPSKCCLSHNRLSQISHLRLFLDYLGPTPTSPLMLDVDTRPTRHTGTISIEETTKVMSDLIMQSTDLVYSKSYVYSKFQNSRVSSGNIAAYFQGTRNAFSDRGLLPCL